MEEIIIGINAFHGDSSACLVIDGKLIAAVEEERFRRIKHWAGLPSESVKYLLCEAGLKISQVGHIAVNRDPKANLMKKALYAFSGRAGLKAAGNRLSNASKIMDIKAGLARELGANGMNASFHNVEHHLAHMASSFYVSPFESAAVVSIDGFGDFVSTMWGEGSGHRIKKFSCVNFPHSLGLFYLAITQWLGFTNYGDEYKVMGLAPYGKPVETGKLKKILKILPQGKFELGLDFFTHHSDGVNMEWQGGEPKTGIVYSQKLLELLGPARDKDAPITDYHRDIAASLQSAYEEAFFSILDFAHGLTRNKNLCLAGGCAMNSSANGKVFENSPFKELYIQSAAGDGGGAIGAAFHVWCEKLQRPRVFKMDHAYLGPWYEDSGIEGIIKDNAQEFKKQSCAISKAPNEARLLERAAQRIAKGHVVGWFQGRMEWGPRALGNRSIVCDPRRADMKDILNMKIKRRESFRPFAPSIAREAVSDWFKTDYDVPFMLQIYEIRAEKRSMIPAVTHVNGTGRLQTVTEKQNPRYYRLIKEFERLTGVPIVLNTSFNENEPIVCKPQEAIDCFLRTRMDALAIGDWLIERATEGDK